MENYKLLDRASIPVRVPESPSRVLNESICINNASLNNDPTGTHSRAPSHSGSVAPAAAGTSQVQYFHAKTLLPFTLKQNINDMVSLACNHKQYETEILIFSYLQTIWGICLEGKTNLLLQVYKE